MKILVISDTESKTLYNHFVEKNSKDIDLIISCGDVKPYFLEYLVTMINAPLLYVPGNHDTTYSSDNPSGCINIDMKSYNHKGFNIVGIGGCRRYKQGPHQYTDFEMALRVLRMTFKLRKADIIVTHSPPLGLGDRDSFVHKGFKSFRNIILKYSPKYFLHGHNHLNYDRQSRICALNNTTIINGYDYYILEY